MIDDGPNGFDQANERPGHSRADGTWSGRLVSFPDVIETTDDSPVVLSCLLDSTVDHRTGSSGLRIIRINGVDASSPDVTPLPGIRVGDGEGCGYVFRRAFDGQLVFAPDADYTGITTFTYTVADDTGDEASVIATLSVRPATDLATDISFANGLHFATVSEGVDAAIIGSLTIAGFDVEDRFDFKVYEGQADTLSARFTVSGDKLQVMEPLDHTKDGTIQLRIVAEYSALGLVSSDFTIEVRPTPPEHPWLAEAAGHARALRLPTPRHAPCWTR